MINDLRDKWLASLKPTLGINRLCFSSAGVCYINFSSSVSVKLEKLPNNDGVFFSGCIDASNLSSSMMKEMLIDNFKSINPLLPILSLERDGSILEAHCAVPNSLLEHGEEVLEQLVACIEYWKLELDKNISKTNT
ncbi:hypothetical protein L4C34_02995 [Vibrio profundum]|uniref:hypothetical protein n=1 Tax=Vibrio profundum TaxID=2910247 RepID=UPI003D147CB9